MGGEGPLWSINKNPTRGTLLEETTEAKSPLKGHEIYWQIVSITQGGHNVGQNLINEIDIMVQCISGHLASPRSEPNYISTAAEKSTSANNILLK